MIFRPPSTPRTLDEIARHYAQSRGIPLSKWYGTYRHRNIAHPRQDCMALMQRETGACLGAIGRVFNRDHTTVLHGIKASKRRAAQ